MKRSEFQKSEQNMADLNELLRHPIMRTAIEIVKAESVGLPDPIPGVDYESQVAACGAFTAGAFRAFEKLESLCYGPMGIAPGSMPRQTQYDDAAKARMREQGIYTDKEIEELK
jgi:hypothetical protein